MKYIVLGSVALLSVAVLGGCNNSDVANNVNPFSAQNLTPTAENETASLQDLQAEALRIQQSDELTKDQKAEALRNIQKRIKAVMDRDVYNK